MRECNKESFFQRSLPLSAILGVGSYMAGKAGYFKQSPKWGPWPKAIVGGLLGYVIGKYSYQNKCAEKLMRIPNSEIGRVLRERRGKLQGDILEGNIALPKITPGSYMSSESMDYNQNNDLDYQKPMNTLDTDYRPDYDSASFDRLNEDPLPSSNMPTSYDDLRTRNRQEYEKSFSKPPYRTLPSNSQPIWENAPNDQTRNSPAVKESRNQYGDVFVQNK
ncbi:OCIA domain-containing protein 1 isoform X2 [Adelges cooleyi]|nr:OCIA domain-containing protein 1 isoform X2 [Adelges cooleyi]